MSVDTTGYESVLTIAPIDSPKISSKPDASTSSS